MDFDIIPYDDIVWGQRLGSGSFGSVYKGTYLGIDIAIKEVLPSTEYDVHKYFEREWRIMRECRHPNIVLFLGLSKAPDDDGRVFIISEFVPRGNLRQFILSSHPFPWRLRLSFATDVARAVAYLHARQCIHRDLKGENLLITSNERVKVTDFGFARIASRNADEMRRMTYCGTDGYMSPEIINGQDFDLPTDVFSLGIIFIEIMSRKLVDSRTYTRQAPSFVPDPAEVQRRASPGCPADLISLALSCCSETASLRPKMPQVLSRLREIELQVVARLDDHELNEHVGSIRLVHHGKRAMPIFHHPATEASDGKDDDDEVAARAEEDALVTLAELDISGNGATRLDKGSTWRTARWEERASVMSAYTDASEMKALLVGYQHLLPSAGTSSSLNTAVDTSSAYSTDVVRERPVQTQSTLKDAMPPVEELTSSTVTVKGMHTTPPPPTDSASGDLPPTSQIGTIPSLASSEMIKKDENAGVAAEKPKTQTKYEKAREEERVEEAGSTPIGTGTHRFTLVSKDATPLLNGRKVSAFTSNFAFAFLPKSLTPANKCPVCNKRLGQRPALQCDDCSVIVHVKCSHAAARNCPGGDGIGGVKE
ncbi:kinase-like domain-containing protein [Naematelia encephala]|uniref:Kinase-like domain-containing protein n=1 Tax=Naematelia encephala TaxID=71784 RepID=A0A1Y2AXP9_9TREE|nr:kinase-like domain-containing protein [Naematelia encephala]